MSETPARDGMLDFALAAFKDSPNPVVAAHANKLADAFEAEVRAPVPSAPADADLRRQLASSERIRENADFHLGQEMARRQLAEKETARLRAVVARLRQMTDHWEQQLPEVIRTPAVVSAIRAALEAADGPSRMADEAQQPETQAQPPRHRWYVEMLDDLADEWVPGTRYPVRERAVNHLNHASAIGPTWKDGTPVQRRLVRETTSYTVEPAAVSQPGKEA